MSEEKEIPAEENPKELSAENMQEEIICAERKEASQLMAY